MPGSGSSHSFKEGDRSHGPTGLTGLRLRDWPKASESMEWNEVKANYFTSSHHFQHMVGGSGARYCVCLDALQPVCV